MKTVLIHHAANNEGSYPSGSLAALQNCVDAGVRWVEVDLIPLADGDFVLLHDVNLESASNGSGTVIEKRKVDLSNLFYRQIDGSLSSYCLNTLSEVADWVKNQISPTQIQLDLKPYAPLTLPVLESLLNHLKPIRERVLISSTADWAIRLLHRLDPHIRLGFDPLLYLDLINETPRPPGVPPLREGAYGLLDEHPLSIHRWGTDGAYFAARAEALAQQAPAESIWYLNAWVLEKALDAGFNWVEFLHQRGSQVAAWTLDLPHLNLVVKLIEHEVDLITTNQAVQLRDILKDQVDIY
jgi:glycerophosphoryl diester phosphodiesterase